MCFHLIQQSSTTVSSAAFLQLSSHIYLCCMFSTNFIPCSRLRNCFLHVFHSSFKRDPSLYDSVYSSGQHYLCQVRIKCFRRPTTARPSLRTLKSKETFRPRDNFQLQDISVLSEPGPSNFTLFRFKSVFAAALTFCVRLFVCVRDLRSILGQPWLRRLPLQPCHRLRSTNPRLVTVSSFSYFLMYPVVITYG